MKDKEFIAELIILIVVIALAIFVACLIFVMISDTQAILNSGVIHHVKL